MDSRYNFGVFISYRRSYAHFAGRIYDYLSNKGFDPFMDVYRMSQNEYREEIRTRIQQCPYFLLVLSNGSFDNISDVFSMEMQTALDCKAQDEIIIVSDENFDFMKEAEKKLPIELHKLIFHQCDIISHRKFTDDIGHAIRNITPQRLDSVISWKERIRANGRVFVASRDIIEHNYATLKNRFGRDLVDAVEKGESFEGINIIKQIRMSCYAATVVFTPKRNMVDDKAYDHGTFFNIFRELLRDPEFSLEILINAPDSNGAMEAENDNMLGNSALEEIPQGVFLSAYAGLIRLIDEELAFSEAYKEKRFRFYLTDTVMTGAIFQVEYKERWSEFDHIKFDLYSYNLKSNMDRRCMIFFKNEDKDNYNHFVNDYNYMKQKRVSKEYIQAHHKEWIDKWKRLEEEL